MDDPPISAPFKPCHYAITATPLLLLLNPNWPHLLNWLPAHQFVLLDNFQSTFNSRAFLEPILLRCEFFCRHRPRKTLAITCGSEPSKRYSLNVVLLWILIWKEAEFLRFLRYTFGDHCHFKCGKVDISTAYKWSVGMQGQWDGTHRLKCGQ